VAFLRMHEETHQRSAKRGARTNDSNAGPLSVCTGRRNVRRFGTRKIFTRAYKTSTLRVRRSEVPSVVMIRGLGIGWSCRGRRAIFVVRTKRYACVCTCFCDSVSLSLSLSLSLSISISLCVYMYVCMYVCILACMDCECAWNCGNCVIPKNHDIGDFEAKKLLAK